MPKHTRRRFIATMGSTALAGCVSSFTQIDDSDSTGTQDPSDRVHPPLHDSPLVLPDTTGALADSRISGGVRKDGIPSIDDPKFIAADAADEWLDTNEPVFGVALGETAKAYPQRVVVWHEIVNDRVGDENVAVTYCPLTGTVQGFKRGETEFGVSGQLVNSNLVMYDRGTDSLWSQMLATAISGDLEGRVLQEFPVTWTTWQRWHDVHADTLVLSDSTGYARNYNDDPYGSYAPKGGFYADDSLFFEPYSRVDTTKIGLKDIVLGARWEDDALAVRKEHLADVGILRTQRNGTGYVAVYDESLDTGYIYRDFDDYQVSLDSGVATVGGEEFSPANLPLDRLIRFDAFWFAWAGFYPNSLVVE